MYTKADCEEINKIKDVTEANDRNLQDIERGLIA
jgi:hypothetical protein